MSHPFSAPGTSPIGKVGLIGDVHCEDVVLEAAIQTLTDNGVDRLLCVGDITDGRGDLERVCTLLREHDVITVRGNHERWTLSGEMRDVPDATMGLSEAARSYLDALPTTVEFETSSGPLMLCHGTGENDMTVLRPNTRGYDLQDVLDEIRDREDLRYIVSGHSHTVMVRELGPWVFINPGTLHRDWQQNFVQVDFTEKRAAIYNVSPTGLSEQTQMVQFR